MLRRSRFVSCLAALLMTTAFGCGGGSPAAPTPTPTPTPLPTPAPEPEPTPTPQPTPTPCVYGLCEAPTTNVNPVTTAILRIYTVQDENQVWLTDWDPKQPILVGYTVRLDLTGKDAYNKDTLGARGVEIRFDYSDQSLIEETVQSDWQRKLAIKASGTLKVVAIFDGVKSNTLTLELVDR